MTIRGEDLNLHIEESVPSDAMKLIWNEFFESRNRGIDWATHLPWTTQGNTLCASARTKSEIVGTLLIRCLPPTSTALVGYVCVQPSHRGQNLSRMLIEYSANALAARGFTQLVLWTGKPQVYQNSGFAIVAYDQSIEMRIEPQIANFAVCLSPWPVAKDRTIGLPPFALAGWLAEGVGTSIVFVDTPTGATLLQENGIPSSVIQIMSAARPGNWSMMLDAQSPLAIHASENNLIVKSSRGPVTMVRSSTGTNSLSGKVPLTERI